jgi:hypothetical protein
MDCLLYDLDEPSQDEMSLNEKDWERLDKKFAKSSKDTLEEVAKLIDAAVHPPSGFRRWLKEWATAGAAITGAVALVGITLTAVYFAVSESSKNSEFRGTTIQHLKDTDSAVSDLRNRIASSNPTDPENQKAAKDLLTAARRKNAVPIPLPAIEESGKRFIEVSDRDPKAWDVAVDYVNYRTELNRLFLGTGWELGWSAVDLEFQRLIPPTPPTPGRLHMDSYQRGFAALADAFAFFPIGSKNPWLDGPQASGNEFPRDLRLDYGIFKLDGMNLKNVWFVNSIIQYSGGPLLMNNVVFIDCRFVMPNVPKTRSVATTLLAKASVGATIN